MDKAKYLTGLLLIVIAMVYIGELYVCDAGRFEEQYMSMTFYKPIGVSQEDMLSRMAVAAEEHEIQLFVVDRKKESMISMNISVYGTKGTAREIQKLSQIKTGNLHSLFLKSCRIKMFPFQEISDISRCKTYYAIGEDLDIREFKNSLIDTYGGSFPREGDSTFDSVRSIAVVWSCVFLFLLLLTLYNIAFIKKEIVIRLVSGERLFDFATHRALTDAIVYFIIFLGCLILLKPFTNTAYHWKESLLCLILFLLVNTALYGWLFIVDYRRGVAKKNSAKRVLRISYVFQIVAVFITVIVTAGCVEIIQEGIDFSKQKSFFEKNKDYSYTMISPSYKDLWSDQTWSQFCQTYSAEQKSICLVELDDGGQYGYPYIYADQGAIPYLKEAIPELNDISLEEKAYFLKPRGFEKLNLKDQSLSLFRSYYNGGFTYEELFYKGDTKIIAINGMDKTSSLMKNPVILISNIPADRQKYIDLRICQASMLNISDDEWEAFVREGEYENDVVYKTNVYEYYQLKWSVLKRGICTVTLTLFLLLMLECAIVKNLIGYEYYVNGVELSVKRLLGYRLWEIHWRILLTTVYLGVLGVVVAATASYFWRGTFNIAILTGGTIIILLEILVIVKYTLIIEKANIQKILKGGFL